MLPIKVAIMGAGLAGLACAIMLEKNGIEPVIFEKRRQVGDRFINGEILMSILNRPIDDCLAHFSQNYGIYLQPVGNIGKAVIFSENNKAELTGQIGFSNIRGRHPHSFENQLARQVKTGIEFNSEACYEELLEEYTHVVMATGDGTYAGKVQNYRPDLTATLKGAIVTGKFDRYTVYAWLNNHLAPKGYGWLIPLSEKEANIVIGYPDYSENKEKDPNVLWERFYEDVCNKMGQYLKVVDRFEVNRYLFGICKYPRIGNTFFTGNCFGAIMPFLGFGQFPALLTGIYAAHDLSGKGKYDEMTGHLRQSYQNSLVVRRALEKLDNRKLDTLVKAMDTEWGNRAFNAKKFDLLKFVSYLLRPATG